MESLQHLQRLLRMVQETGERMVVSLIPDKDPIVILPLSEYEQLTRNAYGHVSQSSAPRAFSSHAHAPQRPISRHDVPFSAPDPADSWDGEDYDTDRIFAQIDREKKHGVPSHAPDRLQASISRASEALQGDWLPGNGGQRLPIRNQALQSEERFSLGAG